jgi:uncharacterized membrane protein
MVAALAALAGVVAIVWAQSARRDLKALHDQVTSLAAEFAHFKATLSTPPQVSPSQPPIGAASTTAQRNPPAAVTGTAPPTQSPTAQATADSATATVMPTTSLEERLGTRWAVWVGGLALALGGLLLVRYSIEQGFFGPGARITLAAAFALLLLTVGEWFRRSERAVVGLVLPAAHVPSILTAAGTACAFGTIYAAYALYGFIGSTAAFILLGATGIATMLAAALHGPALAGLGLAGAFVVPLLVSANATSAWPLVVYLAVVGGAAHALARLRRWLWLAAAAVTGALLWGLALLAPLLGQLLAAPAEVSAAASAATTAAMPWTSAVFVHVGVQLALAAAFMAIEPHVGTREEDAAPDWIASAALCALVLLAVAALGGAQLDGQWTLFAFAAMAILMATAWRSAPCAAAMVLAGVVALGALAVWPGLQTPPASRLLAPAVAGVLRLPENITRFLGFAGATTLLVCALATVRLWRGRALPLATAGLYALAATVPPLAALVLAYLRVTQFDRSIAFAFFAVFLAAVFYLLAARFSAIAATVKTAATGLAGAAYAASTSAAMALAFTMALDRGYLTVAFALTALATAIYAVLERIVLLRYVTAAIGFIVLGRLAWDPRIMGADVGVIPIFNWLLLGYGVPALAFLGAGHVLKRTAEDLAARICDALGLVFAALLAFFQIRHIVHGGNPLAADSGHVEQGLLALMAFGFAYVLLQLDCRRDNVVFRTASLIFGVLAAAFVTFGLAITENPLLTDEQVAGGAVFSSLLLAYLLPGLSAAVLARASRGIRPFWYVTGAAVLALLLMLAYVTLEVRHIFQGAHLAWRSAGAAEVWAYSAAWLLLGLLFLAYGIWRRAQEARLASAALIVLAVLKVFLYDLSGTTGLWRASSLICLGGVLIGIGLVYQKLIFARPRPASAPRAAGAR